MKNIDVIKSWLELTSASAANLSTYDGCLFSYKEMIAKIVDDTAFITTKKFSRTTSTHTNFAFALARRYKYDVIRVDNLLKSTNKATANKQILKEFIEAKDFYNSRAIRAFDYLKPRNTKIVVEYINSRKEYYKQLSKDWLNSKAETTNNLTLYFGYSHIRLNNEYIENCEGYAVSVKKFKTFIDSFNGSFKDTVTDKPDMVLQISSL